MKRHPLHTAIIAGITMLSVTSTYAAEEKKVEQLELEVIEVTAQKKSQNLNEVPISVAVVGSEFVEAMNISQLDDLSSYVPNFNITEGASGMNIAMRGLGSGTNKGFEQSVGMFIDGIYSSRSKQFAMPFFDVERVEILRGPQGVLFGKNTTAGAVNIVSARPNDHFSGKFGADYDAEYQDLQVTAIVNGALSDNLNARLATKVRQQDKGYLENTITGKDERLRDEKIIRLSLDWNPTDELELYSKLEYSKQDLQGGLYQLFDFGSYEGFMKMVDPDAENKVDLQTSTGRLGVEHHVITEAINGVVEASYEMENLRIVSVTGYSQYDAEIENEDSDFTPVPLIWFDTNDEFEQFSQELRFELLNTGNLEYIGGFYFQNSEYLTTPRLAAELSIVGYPDTENERSFAQDTTTWSAFAQVVWNISDKWQLQGGLRYNDEKKDVKRALEIQEFNTDIPEMDPTTLFINAYGLGIENYADKGSRSEKHWSPMFALQYNINDKAMTYAKYTRGFKGGGFDSSDLNGSAGDFNEEQVDNYELGTKLLFWQGRAALNAAMFYSEYQDLQVYSMSGVRFLTTNAAEATAKGLEVDLRAKLTESLSLNTSFALLDAVYDDYQGGSCTYEQLTQHNASGAEGACTQDLSGRSFIRAPEFQMNVGLTHEVDFSNGAYMVSGISVNYTDEQYVKDSLPEYSLVSGYTTVDASMSFTTANEDWIFKISARNLTDERVPTLMQSPVFFDDTVVTTVNTPRTISFGVEYKFD
ncbi:TonB-dependent receptor [Thalassotalea sp. G2M2-11]|uniref:TonB-dependent receptor n=1 Tax=Thalassotalea sp. G2M2-11 TaxID=2787627 RepID=UPI0019CF964A|nr:TonB-dependent receptor [Thalassotalea sp. G2M2-11]